MRTNENGRAQVTRGRVYLALIAAAASFDLINNVNYGLSAGGPMLAGAFVVAAVALLVLPWNMGWEGAARTAALLMTIWASSNAYLADLSNDQSVKASQAERHRTAVADATAARAKLSQIAETGDVAALTSLEQRAAERATNLRNADTQKMGTASCFAECKKAEKESLAITRQLADARARDTLKAEIARADTKAAEHPTVEPNAVAATLATWTGIEADRLTRGVFLATAMLAIIVSVSIETLAEKALDLIASGRAEIKEAKDIKARADRRAAIKAAPVAVKAATPAQRGRKGKLEADKALEMLREIARKTDGRIVGSNATLAALLDVHPNTLCDTKNGWLARWEKHGLVRIESKKRGQKVVLVETAKAA